MYKIAVIGDRESVMGFRALGLTAVVAENGEQGSRSLRKLADDNYAVIYVTEQLAAKMQAEIARYIDNPQCAVIPIPSKEGALGIGQREMHQAVERAVGADILKDKE